jgi:hypothetical protein
VLEKLRAAGEKVMVVPHCGGNPCNLDFFDAAMMPMLEIHSAHRNFEHVAAEALRRGLRVGFIGGSDDHRGAIGDSRPVARDHFFATRAGLVAAYARRLTREDLWEAFFSRRVYATNGVRTVLDFRINGMPMGGRLAVASGEEIEAAFYCRTDGFLDHVELVCGAETVARSRPEPMHPSRTDELRGHFRMTAPSTEKPYYLRVFETDGGMAWSSPIWVELASTQEHTSRD